MAILSLAFKSLLNRKLTFFITLFSIAISVTLLLGVQTLKSETKTSFMKSISGTDLIIGARGASSQLLLSSVFHIGNTTNTIKYDSYQEIAKSPAVEWAVPVSLGDSHQGYTVMATDISFFTHYSYANQQHLAVKSGELNEDMFAVVIGADVARKLDYKIGDEIIMTHSGGEIDGHDHDTIPYFISAILAPSFTAIDQTLIISLEAMEAMHTDSHGHFGALPNEETFDFNEPLDPVAQEDLHAHDKDHDHQADNHEEHDHKSEHADEHEEHDHQNHHADEHEDHDHESHQANKHEEHDHKSEHADEHEEHDHQNHHADEHEDHDHESHQADEHKEHDHQSHQANKHKEHDHENHQANEHEEHDHENHQADEHKEHDHENHQADEHKEHDHENHQADEHKEHDHESHQANGHKEHDHKSEHADEHEGHNHQHDSYAQHEDTPEQRLARALKLKPDNINAVFIGLTSRQAILGMQSYVNNFQAEPLTAIMPAVALQELWQFFSIAEVALNIVTTFVVLVGLLGMLSIILMSLNERRREMAILRSVGARPAHIFSLIIGEAGFVCFSGILLGIALLYLLLFTLQVPLANYYGFYLDINMLTSNDLFILATIQISALLIALVPGALIYKYSLSDGMSIKF